MGKANKGINVEKIIIGLKKFFKRGRGKQKKKENSTELQKPSVEAEVYNNKRKCDWIYTYTYIPISKIKMVQQKLNTVQKKKIK